MAEVEQPGNQDNQLVELDRQTEWALARTHLAEERTFNAWLRSGLAIMAFSMAITRFFTSDPAWLLDAASIILFTVGGVLIVFGYRIYHQSILRLSDTKIAGIPRWLVGVVVITIIILVAILLLLSLIHY